MNERKNIYGSPKKESKPVVREIIPENLTIRTASTEVRHKRIARERKVETYSRNVARTRTKEIVKEERMKKIDVTMKKYCKKYKKK